MEKETQKTNEIVRDGRYSIRVLTRDHIEEAIAVATQEFVKKEPLSLAFFKSHPNRQAESRKEWTKLWRSLSDDFFSNGLSVGLFDTENNDKLVGTLLGKVFGQYPQNYSDQFEEGSFMDYMFDIFRKLKENVRPEFNQILDNPEIKITDMWAGAILD